MLNLRVPRLILPPKNEDLSMKKETEFRVTYKEPQTSSKASWFPFLCSSNH